MMDVAKIIWALARRRTRWTRDSRHLDGVVVERGSVDGGVIDLSDSPALQDDLIGGASHFTDV